MSNKLFNLTDRFGRGYTVVAEDFTQAIRKFDCFAKRKNNNSRMIIVGDLKGISLSDEEIIEADDSEEQTIKTETK